MPFRTAPPFHRKCIADGQKVFQGCVCSQMKVRNGELATGMHQVLLFTGFWPNFCTVSFLDHFFFCTISFLTPFIFQTNSFWDRLFFSPFIFLRHFFFWTIALLHHFFSTGFFLHHFFPHLFHAGRPAGQSGVSGRMDELRVSTSCSLTHLYHLRFFFDPPTPSILCWPTFTTFDSFPTIHQHLQFFFWPSNNTFVQFFWIMTDQFFVDPSPSIWVDHHHYRVWPVTTITILHLVFQFLQTTRRSPFLPVTFTETLNPKFPRQAKTL